jgi:hypothetical protein
MGETKDWLPIVAILGPIIAATITALVTRHFRERRRIDFLIAKTEDLTLPLFRTNNKIILSINDRAVLNINRSLVHINNSGNVSVTNFACWFRFLGNHQILGQEIYASSDALRAATEISPSLLGPNAPYTEIKVQVPFLNPKEWFQVMVLFDQEPVDGDVVFRLEGVRHTIKRSDRISAFAPEIIDALLAIYPPGVRELMKYLVRQVRPKRKSLRFDNEWEDRLQ